MGVADYGTGTDKLSAPQLAAWAGSVASALNGSNVTVNDRIQAWLTSGVLTATPDGIFNVMDYGATGKLLLDVDDNRYLLADVEALPAWQRNLFRRYVYW